MDKAKRIAIAKDVLKLVEQGQPEYGEESWEADIGRFIDKERFDLEKQKLFLERAADRALGRHSQSRRLLRH